MFTPKSRKRHRGRQLVPVSTLTSFLDTLEHRRLLAAPAAPVITEPVSQGLIVSRFDVHMEVDPEAYSDPDGHAHASTRWQIRETAANGGAIVWQADAGDPLGKVHIHLGDGAFVGTLAGQSALLANRSYVLHVTFTDSNSEVSVTSQRGFQTASDTTPVPGAGTWIVREGYKLELAAPATSFRLPVNIAFVPNPGLNPTDPLYYVAELYGSIKLVSRSGSVSTYATGLLDYNPSGPISGTGEQGLTGIAVDPVTGDLYVAMLWNNGTTDAQRGGATLHFPKIERLHSNDGGKTMATRTILLNMQPETQGQSHQISNISIGPDNKLYVHMGDGFTASTALNLDQFRGKVLRMNKDGTPVATGDPAGANPFYDASNGINSRDYIFTYGHRNPFGGAWRLSNGKHWVVENGNSLDRMVDLTAGASYGWAGNDSALNTFSKYVWNPATAPVNIAFIQPQTFGGSLFPSGSQADAFVSLSGATYAPGPQSRAKSIEWFTDLDTLNAGNKLAAPPLTLIKYNGTGRATISALAAGPDGLYFSDLYRDDGVGGATAAGANVYRIRYVDFYPRNVTASPGHGQVTLNWSNDLLSTGTNIYRFINPGDTPVLIASNVPGSSFIDTGLTAGITYRYIARAVNAGGESTDANLVTATPTIPSAFTGTSAGDTYYLKRNGSNLEVWIGSDVGAPTHRVVYSAAPALSFAGNGGDDSLTLDFAAGDLVPAGGIIYDGGNDNDQLVLRAAGPADVFSINATQITRAGSSFDHGGADTLVLHTGTFTFSADLAGKSITARSAASVTFNSTQHLGALGLFESAGASLSSGAAKTIFATGFAMDDTATFDLKDNDLRLELPPAAIDEMIEVLNQRVRSARNPVSGARWSGVGLISSHARDDLAQHTTLAVVPTPGGVRVLYTWNGDADADLRLTSDDYKRIDLGFLTRQDHFHQGNFNFDDRIDVDDYALIDGALLSQVTILN